MTHNLCSEDLTWIMNVWYSAFKAGPPASNLIVTPLIETLGFNFFLNELIILEIYILLPYVVLDHSPQWRIEHF